MWCGGLGSVTKECGSYRRKAEVSCCSGFVCDYNTKKCIEPPSTGSNITVSQANSIISERILYQKAVEVEAKSKVKSIKANKKKKKKNKNKKKKGKNKKNKKAKTSSNDATFTTASLSLTVKQDGTISLVRPDNNKVISTSRSTGWSIYNRYAQSHTPLDTMVKVGSNELQLSTSDGKYKVNVAITAKDRYLKFELIHVSNNPQTGELDNDWPGNRVMFDVVSKRQKDGMRINTLILNPMSELKGRAPYRDDNGIHFNWPYPQWNQTDDRPQPQGAVAAYGFVGATEHDDILKDIWVAEESLPRPNRKNLSTWTRDDIDGWLDRWHKAIGKPYIRLDLDPKGVYQNLFTAADLAYQGGMNAIYLSQHSWQDAHIGDYNSKLFPNGREDAIAWKEYCDERGISIHLHGFAHPIRKDDPYYGRGVVPDELSSSAAGILLEDVPAEAKGYTFLVEPDLDYMIGMKEGMMPFYDVNAIKKIKNSNGGLGANYPPYYEKMSSRISLDKNLYKYTATLTSDNKWKVSLGNDRWSRASTTPLVDHKKGTKVKFILMSGNGNYFTPDSRSNIVEEQAVTYSKLLNDMGAGTGYDGAAMSEDLGSWGLRRFSQEVYERMDHPASTRSSFGVYLFGHFEYQFKNIRDATKRSYAIPVYLSQAAALAPGLDAANQGASKGAQSLDISLRSIHSGITVDTGEDFGLCVDFGRLLLMWSKIKLYLSPKQSKMIAGTKDDFYAASETEDQWKLTKTRAMRRPGVDGNWNTQPERPDVAPRQHFKANGEVLYALDNPYDNQKALVELHVMAGMSSSNEDNISLMPAEDDIINPSGAEQTLGFSNNKLSISVDNSDSSEIYEYYTRKDTVGYWLQSIDMSNSRGVAITVIGDGSGSTLVLSTGGFPRMYAVDIDFIGEQTIEIPNGEVCNNREGWNIFDSGSITQFKYESVDRFRLFLHKVPAATKAFVEVTRIVAMKENRDTGLIDPELTLNEQTLKVHGTIPYNHYLVYSEGESARVYNSNWNEVEEQDLSVTGDVQSFMAVQGSNSFSVMSESSSNTWLSSRIKVEDSQNHIVIQKPSDA